MSANSGLLQACSAVIATVSLAAGAPWVQAQEQVTCDAKCAAIVFADSGGSLSTADKQAIASILPFKVAASGKGLVDSVCEQDAGLQVSIPDLNGDGATEVFILAGNTCLSGNTGSNLWLFIKGKSGKYSSNLGFPAGGYDVLETKNQGYPDLKLGGPGFCSAVWRWNGTAYDFLKNQEEEPGGCEELGQ